MAPPPLPTPPPHSSHLLKPPATTRVPMAHRDGVAGGASSISGEHQQAKNKVSKVDRHHISHHHHHHHHQQQPSSPQQQQPPSARSSATSHHSSTTSLAQPPAPFVPNNSLPTYIKHQIAAHQSQQQQRAGAVNSRREQALKQSATTTTTTTPTSPPPPPSAITASQPNSFSTASQRPIVNASTGSVPPAAPAAAVAGSSAARLRAAAAAASGQHHHGAGGPGPGSGSPGSNPTPIASSLAAKLQSLKLSNTASRKPCPLITPPPSYSASRSSSSGPQSPSLTISSSSTDYSTVPPFIPNGSTPYVLFQNLRKPLSPVGHGQGSSGNYGTQGNYASYGANGNHGSYGAHHGAHHHQPTGASVVINSATAGIATIPNQLQHHQNHHHYQHHHQQQQPQSKSHGQSHPMLQPSSSRKAISQSPIIMQSVKSQKINKPVLQTAIGPNSAIKGYASTPNVPASSSSSMQNHPNPNHHHPHQHQHQHTVIQPSGVAPSTPPSPLYISSSSSNVSFSNVPSPVPSTTSSAKSGSTNNRNPPPPYSSVHHQLINSQQSNGGSGNLCSRAPSSCGSSSSARTSPRTVPTASESSSPAYPPPPYSAAIQSVANRMAAASSGSGGGGLSPGPSLDSAATPPPPLPPYQIAALEALPAQQQQELIAQIMSNMISSPPSLYGGSNGSGSTSHQVPTTEPPSYASSMAALAAQRAAVALANTGATPNGFSPGSGGQGQPGYGQQGSVHQGQPGQGQQGPGPQSMLGQPPPAWIANRPLPLPPGVQPPPNPSGHQSNLVNTVESICNSQISALQSTNRPGLNRIPTITDSTVPPLPPKPSAPAGANPSGANLPPAPPVPKELQEVISSEMISDVDVDLAEPNRSSSPIPQTRRHSVSAAAAVTTTTKDRTPGDPSSKVKLYSPAAYKFYMEQHFENLIKSQKQRELRRQQLESEMAKVGLSEQAQCEMRRMLHQKESNYIRLRRAKMDRSMFDKIRTIGVGAFGEVALVRKKDVDVLYAMKTLRKVDVFKRNQVAHVKAERDILAEADNEWVVKLYFSFQDDTYLYFVMDYIPGGDLMSLLIKLNIFDEPLAQFYIAELVLAVESVHKMGFIHRDIKPDNVLIDREGHIKLTDFGLCTGFRWTHDSKYYNHERVNSMDFDALSGTNSINCNCPHLNGPASHQPSKPLERRKHRREHQRCLAHSLVGTPNYIAPEVLMRLGYTQLCDWWSVGVILYEMVVGSPPFYAATPEETQQKVINWRHTLQIPHEARLSVDTRRIITQMCCGAENRLGRNGADEIKAHPFFKTIDFEMGNLRSQPAPYVPRIEHPTDTSNFDAIDPTMLNSDSDYDSEYVNEMADAFGDLGGGPGGPGGLRSQTTTTTTKKKKKRTIDPSDPKHPQHAFFEFTFRRFFDSSGVAIPLRFGATGGGGSESLHSGTDNESLLYDSTNSTTTGSQVSSSADLYGGFIPEIGHQTGSAAKTNGQKENAEISGGGGGGSGGANGTMPIIS